MKKPLAILLIFMFCLPVFAQYTTAAYDTTKTKADTSRKSMNDKYDAGFKLLYTDKFMGDETIVNVLKHFEDRYDKVKGKMSQDDKDAYAYYLDIGGDYVKGADNLLTLSGANDRTLSTTAYNKATNTSNTMVVRILEMTTSKSKAEKAIVSFDKIVNYYNLASYIYGEANTVLKKYEMMKMED